MSGSYDSISIFIIECGTEDSVDVLHLFHAVSPCYD